MLRFNVRLFVANGLLRYPPFLVTLSSLFVLALHQVALCAVLAGVAVLYTAVVWFLMWLFEPALVAWLNAGDVEGPALARTSRGAALSIDSERA
jgi:hypothetical protein